MGVSANTIWNVQADGSSNHGGGFVSGASGTDYSKTIAASLPANNTVTGATSAGAGNTVLTANASADWVGNIVNVTAGTNFTTTAGAARFECISVVVGVSATFSTNVAGASICTGVGAAGAFTVGGALKFYNSATDDTLLENSIPGNIWYIKSGSHSAGAVASLSVGGTSTALLQFIGYTSTQGDTCNGSNRPFITQGGNWSYGGGNTYHANIIFSGSGTAVQLFNGAGGNHRIHNCKFINTSTSANQAAHTISQHGYLVTNCEFISIRGYGSTTASIGNYIGCWFRSSVIGHRNTSVSLSETFTNCLFSGNLTAGLQITSGTSFGGCFKNCTFYGYDASTPVGIGVDLASSTVGARIFNGIFYGLTNAVNHALASQVVCSEDWNNFFGNTTNRTNFVTGPNSIALDPQFKNVVQRQGATATTTSGNHLVQSGATFQTWGITPGTHFLYVVSGTGVTTGIYQIASVDSETQITTTETLSANATADKTWYITTGLDFRVGPNMKGVALSNFSGSMDLGAVQRLEDYPLESQVEDGVIYSNEELEGTLEIPVVPDEEDVRDGVVVGLGMGSLVVPLASDVEDGTVFDNGTVGTLLSARYLWNYLAANITTPDSIGKQIKDNLDAEVSKTLTTNKFLGLK